MNEKILESDITRQIRSLLSMLRIPHWKNYATLGSQRGVPDILGTLPGSGRHLMIEVKKPGLSAKPHQDEFMRLHREAGAIVFVAHSPREVVGHLTAQGVEAARKIKLI